MHWIHRRKRLISAAGAVLVVAFAGVAWAAEGGLDTSFDSDGIVELSTGYSPTIYAAAEQDDGRLVVVGRDSRPDNLDPAPIRGWKIRRYTSSGALDTSFGDSGVVTLFGESEDWRTDEPLDVAIDSQGRILVTGRVFSSAPSNGRGKKGGGQLVGRATLVCLKSNGDLDASFGDGGVVSQDLADNTGGPVAGNILVDASDRIVLGGFASFPYEVEVAGRGKKPKFETRNLERVFLIRYDSGGNLDTNFGDGGIAVDEDVLDGDMDQIERLELNGLAFHGNGFAALVRSRPRSTGQTALATQIVRRYASDGSRDTTFADPEEPGLRTGAALAVDPQNRILIAMNDYTGGGDFPAGLIARFDSDGDLDTTFGSSGYTALQFAESGDVGIGSIAVDASARLHIGAWLADLNDSTYEALVIRLDDDGQLDSLFGTGGFGDSAATATDVRQYARTILIDGQGRAVSAGYQYDMVADEDIAWIARWLDS